MPPSLRPDCVAGWQLVPDCRGTVLGSVRPVLLLASKQIVPQKNDLGIKTWQKVDNNKKPVLKHLNSKQIEQFLTFRYESTGIYNQRCSLDLPDPSILIFTVNNTGAQGCAFMIARANPLRFASLLFIPASHSPLVC